MFRLSPGNQGEDKPQPPLWLHLGLDGELCALRARLKRLAAMDAHDVHVQFIAHFFVGFVLGDFPLGTEHASPLPEGDLKDSPNAYRLVVHPTARKHVVRPAWPIGWIQVIPENILKWTADDDSDRRVHTIKPLPTNVPADLLASGQCAT